MVLKLSADEHFLREEHVRRRGLERLWKKWQSEFMINIGSMKGPDQRTQVRAWPSVCGTLSG